MLTTADLDLMTTNEEWEGFGYLGGRQAELDAGNTELVAKADAMVLGAANAAGMTARELFTGWANQKVGRWFADAMFGCNGLHAENCLPTR